VSTPDISESRSRFLFPYLTGLLAGLSIALILLLFVGYRLGFRVLLNAATGTPPASVERDDTSLSLPDDVRSELSRAKAPIDNAGNPTGATEHDTYLVQPDPDLRYVLRQNVRVSAHMLRSPSALNLDPPVLYLDDSRTYSDRVRDYLAKESRLDYSYSTDSQGFRRTVPEVVSADEILIIGDSVPFGVGVDDAATAASALQALAGARYRIVNAGVGGYDGYQASLLAERVSSSHRYSGLIYVACQNDFDDVAQAAEVLNRVRALSNRFQQRVIVMLVTYMEYNLRDVLLDRGWSAQQIAGTDALRQGLPGLASRAGFEYADWTDIVSQFARDQKSIFARFGLYVDHAHLSPLGNRLMAEQLWSMIREWSAKGTD
jgi:lysophospholipase L1-like esterase